MGRGRVVLAMGRRLWLIVASSVLLVLLAGCQIPGATSGSSGTPNQCTPQVVRQVVERFIDAFNRGDIAKLDLLVSDAQFVWYSTDAPGQRFSAEAYDRSTLMAYFAARHRQHERLVLESFDSTGQNGTEAGFTFRLTRSADDGLPPTAYGGKGAIQCTTIPRSLAVWSMARWPWSPVELLPQAALILLAAGIGGLVLWRRRKGPASKSSARAHTNIPR